jgi:hypothetical protein
MPFVLGRLFTKKKKKKNHGVPEKLALGAIESSKQFWILSEEQKFKVRIIRRYQSLIQFDLFMYVCMYVLVISMTFIIRQTLKAM